MSEPTTTPDTATPDPAAAVPAAAAGAGEPAAAAAAPADPPDPSVAGQPVAAAATPKFEGVDDSLIGETDLQTIENLAGALKAAQTAPAPSTNVPEDPKTYADFSEMDLDETLKPHLLELSNDPVFEAVTKFAHENGGDLKLTQGIVVEAYKAAAAAGILEAPLDETAERAALLPENAKDQSPEQQTAAIDARMNANYAFMDLLVANSGLPKEVSDHAQMMLGDTAMGHQMMEFIQAQLTGAGSAQPGVSLGAPSTGLSRSQLRDELAKPEMQPGHPKFVESEWRALDDQYKALANKK